MGLRGLLNVTFWNFLTRFSCTSASEGTGLCNFNSSDLRLAVFAICSGLPSVRGWKFADTFFGWWMLSWLFVMIFAIVMIIPTLFQRAIYRLLIVKNSRIARRVGHITYSEVMWKWLLRIRRRKCEPDTTSRTFSRYEGHEGACEKSFPTRRHNKHNKSRRLNTFAVIANVVFQQALAVQNNVNQEMRVDEGFPHFARTEQTDFRATVHSITGPSTTVTLNSERQPLHLREDLAKALYFKKGSNLEKNFQIYQVQPHPRYCDNVYCFHFILERPGDRRLDQSIILADIDKISLKEGRSLETWTIPTQIYREELLWELGLLRECNNADVRCVIDIAGQRWHSTDHRIRNIPNGGLVEVRIRTSPGQHCDERGTTEEMDDPFNPREDFSLMQVNQPDEAVIRRATDPIYRMLIDNAFLDSQHRSGFHTLEVWGFVTGINYQRHFQRVWLDPREPSWTWLCQRAIYSTNGLVIPEQNNDDHEAFVVTPTPLPPLTTWKRQVPNFIIVYKRDRTDTAILVDFHYNGVETRRAILYHDTQAVGDIVKQHFRITHTTFRLTWLTVDGPLHAEHHEVPRLPNGAAVSITEDRDARLS